MIAYPVVRLDLLQSTLVTIFEREFGFEFVWGRSNLTREARPYGVFEPISGPTRLGQTHESIMVTTESEYLVDLPVPAVGDFFVAQINGVSHENTVLTTNVEDLRDALVALINADREPATALATLSNQFSITESALGGVIEVAASPSMTVSVGPGSVQQCVKSHRSRSEVTLNLQIHSDTNKVSVGAMDMMANVPVILDLDRTLHTLTTRAFTLQDIAGPTDISTLEGGGARNESRSTMDLIAGITSLYSETSFVIETTDMELVVGSNTIPITTLAP